MASRRINVPVWLVYAVGFVPAVWTFWLAFADRLGADPVRALEHAIGLWALRFLIATLCVTPLRRLAGLNLMRYRRALGLMAFWYALLHLTAWLLFDRGLDAAAVLADIVRRPYITIGMLALAILVPLAATSNAWSIRRLGARRWALLHRLVYAAAALAALHFVMVLKIWQPEPLIYAAIVAVLLGLRAVTAVRRPARSRPQRA
ncbi:protein-methionine-sulfoxide reductase heme-binding subunit MsrQ [Labrys wisconsinensis]|uniref:Protein-methionine-sulfoxide reductase heme-binding subunit MsrQ n=1 Tax=Labrys wisconsinensis TaxID=425677 RepID=A0ABU0J487_9HYPH|nr:protein-methionine-sulfoxide reductase heme-binding subunit MsrQ [Labrys wisconsinensis]MDQ0469090.1 sulfoxide reductase heme-binding subunit YedZ [Labrys wisconsinensis]